MRRQVSSGGPFEKVYGYSRAVRVGEQLHVSGTAAQPPHLKGTKAYQQARAALHIPAPCSMRCSRRRRSG